MKEFIVTVQNLNLKVNLNSGAMTIRTVHAYCLSAIAISPQPFHSIRCHSIPQIHEHTAGMRIPTFVLALNSRAASPRLRCA